MIKERFTVTYRLTGDQDLCREKATNICLEQTVELGDALVPDGFIRDEIMGQIVSFQQIDDRIWETDISYLAESSAFELTQLLNVMFGNSSIKEGIRVEDFQIGPLLADRFSGPQFGIEGMRKRVDVPHYPLICSALKPMGHGPEQLAEMAYQFAMGGIDYIKDDHGLSNQSFCTFEKRVKACVAAVNRAKEKTGKCSVYVPNVTAPATEIMERAILAKQLGAGGILIMPGLCGFDTMRAIAEDNRIDLPIISHPALLGSMVTSIENGFSHQTIFGKLQRLAGADSSVYPNYGGRFGFSKEECLLIVRGCREDMGYYRPIFPTPGGGMSIDSIPELYETYGTEVMFLVGGGLLDRSEDIADNARYFLSLIDRK